MKPELDVEGLKKTKGWEYAVRFAFGGIVTAGAALVTHVWGPRSADSSWASRRSCRPA